MGGFPFVLSITTNAPQGDGNITGQVQTLAILVGLTIRKRLHAVRGIAPVDSRRVKEEVMVADVVAAEVLTKLKGVISVRVREIVDELILRNVTSLRKGRGIRVRTREIIDALIFIEDLGIVESRNRGGRVEDSDVVAQGRSERIRSIW